MKTGRGEAGRRRHTPKAGARWLILAAFASSHASSAGAASAPPPQADAQAQRDFILNNPLQESDYGRVARCIAAPTFDTAEVLDSRRVLFVRGRDTVWLNQLRAECVGLKKDLLLTFEMHGPTLCELDGFRGVPRALGQTSAYCTLGRFERISAAQADVLRGALSTSAKPRHKRASPEPTDKIDAKGNADDDAKNDAANGD